MLDRWWAVDQESIESIEVALLLDGIHRRYGYDFRSYARRSVQRRLQQFLSGSPYETVSQLLGDVLRDPGVFRTVLRYFFVSVTELFRDPHFFLALKEEVYPVLRTWPHLSIWHAGCATGEEVYSNAILLEEAHLYDRSTVYGTDMDDRALAAARAGIYSLETMTKGHGNYHAAGGARTLTDYYHARYDAARIARQLSRRVTFSQHNLASDSQFGTMQLIICRNVLIYFNNDLQNQVLRLLTDSLEFGGFLCLGDKETLSFTAVEGQYSVVDREARIYKKTQP